VNVLATCSTQARGCESAADADDYEVPKAKRQCGSGSSTDAADLDGNAPGDTKKEGAGSDGEGAADVKLRQGTSGIQASAVVAQSTNLKTARNVSCETILERLLTFFLF
jgi:hypothetical protein